MCTSLRVTLEREGRMSLLFGRNMDIETHFGEAVTITPRACPLPFRCLPTLREHYAIMGMAAVMDGYPLYADAMNEMGLCMAGLHFPGNAAYQPPCGFAEETNRIAPFELIPYLLGTCASVTEVKRTLAGMTVSDIHFSHTLPNTPLHWHVADVHGGLIVEVTDDGLQLYDDRAGVLTNNPRYPYHAAHLHRYDVLTSRAPALRREDKTLGETYDLGLGLVGLPGDYTSPARFVRCATLRRLTDWRGLSTSTAVARFFRVLGAVAVPHGCVRNGEGQSHATLYTACMDTATLTYHVCAEENTSMLSIPLTETLCRGRVCTQLTEKW